MSDSATTPRRRVLGEAQDSVHDAAAAPEAAAAAAAAAAGAAGAVAGAARGATGASPPTDAPLMCPICEESMVSLRQLDRHIEDAHEGGGVPEAAGAAPAERAPFEGRWRRSEPASALTAAAGPPATAAAAGPPAASPRRVKLDLLDHNRGFSLSEDSAPPSPRGASGASAGASGAPGTSGSAGAVAEPPPLSRAHWQSPAPGYTCAERGCPRPLGLKHGRVNCRRCGRLYCNEHAAHRARLADAPGGPEFAPSRHGVWARVCSACWRQRPRDTAPVERTLTAAFVRSRAVHLEEREAARARLQTRFIKLVNLHVARAVEASRAPRRWLGAAWPAEAVRRDEMAIVGAAWARDSEVPRCPVCFAAFGVLVRRHHCRVCGRIVCDGVTRQRRVACSMEVPLAQFVRRLGQLNYAPVVRQHWAMVVASDDDARMRARCCVECKDALLWQRELPAGDTAVFALYDQMTLVKDSIAGVYAKYEAAAGGGGSDGGSSGGDDRDRLRAKLMSFLRDYETLVAQFKQRFFVAGTVEPLPTLGADYQKLVANVYRGAAQFLSEQLIAVKQLSERVQAAEGRSLRRAQAVVATRDDATPKASAPTSAALTKRQIRELREQLMVMNEQRYIVETHIERVTRQRKFDELRPLEENREELDRMIRELEAKLGSHGF
ncbi:FYVE-type domain-containing protein [[Candida] zeylanoides]